LPGVVPITSEPERTRVVTRLSIAVGVNEDRLPRADPDDDVVVARQLDARERPKRAGLRRRNPGALPRELLEVGKKTGRQPAR
jgi:hypothetical protein